MHTHLNKMYGHEHGGIIRELGFLTPLVNSPAHCLGKLFYLHVIIYCKINKYNYGCGHRQSGPVTTLHSPDVNY